MLETARRQSPADALPTERTVVCGTCLKRKVEKPTEIHQRKLAEFGGLWWPPQCDSCMKAMADVEKQRSADETLQRELERAEIAQKRLMSSGLPAPYLTGRRTTADLERAPNTDAFRSARK
jgi:hypothetical protein